MPLVKTLQDNLMQLLALAFALATFGALVHSNLDRPLTTHSPAVAPAEIAAATVPADDKAKEAEALSAEAAQADARKAEEKPVVRESTAQRRARYAEHVVAAARETKVNPALIHAVITAESAYDPKALSSAGAVGLMQLMPATARRYGVTDRWDPEQNIQGGTRYLSFLLRKFNNNLKLTIAAYNAGEGAVAKHGNRIPPYRETRQYVPKVLTYYKQYKSKS